MLTHEPRVSFIILNWNSFKVTLACLLTLRKLDYNNVEVVVVDNGSVDFSADKLAEAAPEIRLIRNPTNLGFAAGCNVGMRNALSRGADYVLLLHIVIIQLAERQEASQGNLKTVPVENNEAYPGLMR